MRHKRSAYTLFQLLVLLAFLLLLLALLLPAVQKVREAAARMQSSNNLKQIALAAHNYHDTHGKMCSGVDSNHFSGLVHLLPYIEQDNLFRSIDRTKSPDHADNATWRAMRIKVFESPLDTVQQSDEKSGPTNYFLVAGTKHALEDNDGLFYRDSGVKLTDITDGTSNTVMTIESSKGDGGTKAVSLARQHVRLKKEDLKGLKDEAGVTEFKDSKNIVGTRGSSWMDGRFLQSTINLNRAFNDTKPDVDCGGEGGLSGPRAERLTGTNVGMADGSVRFVVDTVKLETWKALATRAGGEVLPGDF
jgi:competence protein ComGC